MNYCKPKLYVSKVHYLSVVCLMLAERSLRTGPGSMVGSPVAEVVVVQVDEILLSNPGGRLRLKRCNTNTHDYTLTKHFFPDFQQTMYILIACLHDYTPL